MSEKIQPVPVSVQHKKDYTEYALYVQKHRVTPEFRDGLKPVQRRIIYTAWKYNHAVDLVKSANIIGSTMAKLHPHGDSSIEGALYILVNWFQTKYPLFDGQGNFGTTYINSPAAPRYTKCKLSQFTIDCILSEMIQNEYVIDWEDNYERTSKEPLYLPAKLPLLLVNGSSGIGVGLKIDIPSHNINEVIDATIHLIKHPDSQITLIPDHCQKCEIIDTDWTDICSKGSGKYKVRGVIDIEQYNGQNKKYLGYPILVIKSCPNLTFLNSIHDDIQEMVSKNKIIGIVDYEDQSDEENMRFVYILKPGTDPQFIKNHIYKHTRLQQTFSVNFIALDSTNRVNKVIRFSYTEYLKSWIKFRRNTKLRYFYNRMQKILTDMHVIESYIWAIESGKADIALKVIKEQNKIDDAATIEALVNECNITDIQARFFMNCEIKKLSKGYLKQYKDKYQTLSQEAQYCKDSVLIDGKLEEIIIEELMEIKKKYGRKRVCSIIKESEINGDIEGTFKIVITENNFIRKIGVNDAVIVKNDPVKFIFNADNSKDIILFGENGRAYKIPVSKIQFTDKNNNGIDIRIINKYINTQIVNVIYVPDIELNPDSVIITLTKSGFIKKMDASDFLSVPLSGIVYSKMDDDLINEVVLFGNQDADIVVYNHSKALRISVTEIPLLKRNSKGNIAMNSEIVEGFSLINNNTTDIVVVTAKGYMNKLVPDSIKTGRAKKGNNVIKLTKGDYIIGVYGVNSNNIIRCITETGNISEIKVESIPVSSTVSSGTKMVKSKGGLITKILIM